LNKIDAISCLLVQFSYLLHSFVVVIIFTKYIFPFSILTKSLLVWISLHQKQKYILNDLLLLLISFYLYIVQPNKSRSTMGLSTLE